MELLFKNLINLNYYLYNILILKIALIVTEAKKHHEDREDKDVCHCIGILFENGLMCSWVISKEPQ